MAGENENRILPRGANWFERSLTSSNLTTALNPPPPSPAADPPRALQQQPAKSEQAPQSGGLSGKTPETGKQ